MKFVYLVILITFSSPAIASERWGGSQSNIIVEVADDGSAVVDLFCGYGTIDRGGWNVVTGKLNASGTSPAYRTILPTFIPVA